MRITGEDPRLARLYDYTKFHIGIYLAAGTTMITVLATKDESNFLKALIKNPLPLKLAMTSMAVAGFAGGIVVSSCAIASTFDEVWQRNIGPWGARWWPGSWWARLEHTAFWCGVVLFALATLLR